MEATLVELVLAIHVYTRGLEFGILLALIAPLSTYIKVSEVQCT